MIGVSEWLGEYNSDRDEETRGGLLYKEYVSINDDDDEDAIGNEGAGVEATTANDDDVLEDDNGDDDEDEDEEGDDNNDDCDVVDDWMMRGRANRWEIREW